MDELHTMSNQEITRMEAMQRIKDKRLTQAEAARMLNLSVRQIKRIYRAYKVSGAKGLISARRGKPSNHQLDTQVEQQALDLLKEKYAGFGPTLAHEKLTEVHQLQLSRESLRRIMIAEGLWKPKRAKRPSAHQMRERRACFGELVQIDGSDHAWFEERGPKCTLLVYIDDATGQLGELWFVPDETFFAYCEASRHYFERYGKPVAFYSDKHGIFRVNQPRPLGLTNGLTQFGRAMQELDVQIICANTPQAKGRIERANQTLQDRLVKELRLRNIADIEAGNAYLPEFRADFNRRFAVLPRSSHDAHRPLLKTDHLDLILTHQKTGSLSKNLTVQYDKVIYQIQSDRPDYTLRNAQVTVCENAKGDVTILYNNKPLSYTIYHKSTRQAEVVDTKTLDRQIKTPKPQLLITPGISTAIISMANPSRKPLPMAHTDMDWLVSLSLSAKNWAESKEQSDLRSALSLASCRRSGCSPAVPYPPHECHQSTISSYSPLAKVTSLLCRKGDISILH